MKSAKYTKLALSLCVSALSAACVTGSSIYYDSQAEADRALAAFDKANPECQLWTNWQKMCSRTGPDGETFCQIDPDKPVEPSAPFCSIKLVEAEGRPLLVAPKIPDIVNEDASSGLSRNRYCKTFWTDEQKYIVFAGRVPASFTEKKLCAAYVTDRPFNGLTRESQNNWRCNAWDKTEAGMYYCTEKTTDEACDILTNGVSPSVVTEDGIYKSREYGSADRPVWGLWCNLWKAKR